MKKRNKSPKAKGAARAGSTRGGRGGSRGGGKNSREPPVQRQTNATKSNSTSGYSFLTSRFNTSNNSNRRRGGIVGATTNTGAGIKTKDNSHINNVVGGNGRIPIGGMNVNGAVDAQAAVPANANYNSTNNNFYLHKKFKKVTSTPASSGDSTINELGSSATSSNAEKGSLNKVDATATPKVNGDIALANGIINFDKKSDISQGKNDGCSKISDINPVATTNCSTSLTPITRQSSVSSASSSESISNSQFSSNSSSSVVYKPKFRISTDIDVVGGGERTTTGQLQLPTSQLQTPATSTLSLTCTSSSQESGKEKEIPSRQSLDDRISKIIDMNQSILATWPEHLNKRLKGHGNKSGPHQNSSPRTNSQVVIMSGGSTTEINNSNHNNNNVNQTLNLSTAHNLQQLPSTSSRLPCFEIASEMGYSSSVNNNVNHLSHPVHSSLIFPTFNTGGGGGGPSSSTLETVTDFSDNCVKDLTFANCGSSSTTSMVPKKRRRMSPTPSRLCGGEVSELPVNEGSSANKNYFQDVDMTVRVSNCGPSGAQVTIRTNNQSNGSANGSIHQSAVGVGAVDFSRLIDGPLPLTVATSNKNHPLSFSADPFSNDKPMSLSTKDDSCSAIDLKVTKIRGKSPRKAKVHSQMEVGGEGGSASTTLPVVDFSFPSNKTEKVKASVIMMSPNPNPLLPYPSNNSAPSPKFSMSPNSDTAAEQGRELSTDNSEKSPLESSNPNPKRPTFLALKPTNCNLTKLTEPSVLPSPDTPRGNKQYKQLCMNGNAYTSLGFKVSTRSSYTCLFKAQPMFVPQDTDSKLSMYSNWQPRPVEYKEGDVSLSANDYRVNGRKSPLILYTSALGKGCDTLTVSSPVRQAPISSPVDSSKSFPSRGIIDGVLPAALPADDAEPEQEEPSPTSHNSETSVVRAAAAISPSSRACTSPESSWSNKTGAAGGPLSLVTKSNGLVRSACLSPPSNSCGSNSNSYQHLPSSTNVKGGSGHSLSTKAAIAAASFSESSSADESSSSYSRNPSTSHGATPTLPGNYSSCEQPLSLTINQNRSSGIGANGLPEDNNSTNSSILSPVVMNRFDNPRVRIMEGGFESNEDYTYVRGRGRGRYVCEACGIRCKKPSMLRKHLKTHTDLRPYTCKLCNFSFKTKGNLTKHQKSKSHHKKCSSLGIHPNSSRSLAMIGPSFSISDTNTTDDNDSDEDDDGVDNEDMESDSNSQGEDGDTRSSPENYNENASFEKEIAQSLLDLSKMSRMPLGSQSEDSSNTNVAQEPNAPLPSQSQQPLTFSVRAMLEEQVKKGKVSSSVAVPGSGSSPLPHVHCLEAPMDLSFKAKQNESSEPESKMVKLEKNGYVRSFGIVGEAQRWEPDEDMMLNGCLNLKKVRNVNTSSNCEEKKASSGAIISDSTTAAMSISPPAPSQPPPAAAAPTTQVDIKPEIFEFPVENKEQLEESKSPPVFVGKRKRDSSVSSTESVSTNVKTNASLVPKSKESFQPLATSQQDTQRSLTPPTATATATVTASATPTTTTSSSNSAPKQQKLHQPWLSSPEAKEKEAEVVDSSVPAVSVANVAAPPAQPSPPNVAIQPTERFSPKPPPPGGAVVKISPEREIDVGTNEPVFVSSIEPPQPADVPSPNSKLFPPAIAAMKPQAEFRQPSGAQALVKDEGKAECNVCGKSFARASQLTLHMNIHYLERPFRCDPCGVSFRTKGHLIKHRRSSSHDCKVRVYLTEAWGVANEENPRPFKCPDCKIAFRIHGHLAKHLRSKMHIMRMECLGKLPFGIYFEMEKSGMNLNEIDTTDCDMSLVSLQNLARKIYGENWMERLTAPTEEPA